MGKRRILLIVVACSLVAGGVWIWRNHDPLRTPARRAWKNEAVEALRIDLGEADYLKRRFGEGPGYGDEWISGNAILFGDGSWMAYRAQCQKEKTRLHDIFIGRGSDGKWYYSDCHFCVGLIILMADGQPESLERFRDVYFLVEFDGVSDEALRQTWDREVPWER